MSVRLVRVPGSDSYSTPDGAFLVRRSYRASRRRSYGTVPEGWQVIEVATDESWPAETLSDARERIETWERES